MRVATLVRCGHSRRLLDTVQSIKRQTLPSQAIVLILDEGTPTASREWIEALARARSLDCLVVSGQTPGRGWNAGAAVVDADAVVCVEAGDTLAREFLERTAAMLDQGAAVVATGAFEHRAGGRINALPAPLTTMAELLAGFDLTRRPWAYDRQAWAALGGFDENLPALEHHELRLRASGAGRAVAALAEPLAERVADPSRPAQTAAEVRIACDHILRKHSELLRPHLVDMVAQTWRRLASLGAHNAAAIARRSAAVEALEQCQLRVADLRAARGEALMVHHDARRLTPVSRVWGEDRGGAIDRRLIAAFLSRHAGDVTGRVLEVNDPRYTRRYGSAVLSSAVVDVDPDNTAATIITDLRAAANVPGQAFDCIILTQTLHVIDDMVAVVVECSRMLRPGGVLLATLPTASRVALEYGPESDFWRVTPAGARRLFAEAFAPGELQVESVGNLLSTTSFLRGAGAPELTPAEVDVNDHACPTLVTVRATKTGVRQPTLAHGLVLMYHRVTATSLDPYRLAVGPDAFRRQLRCLRDYFDVVPLADLMAFTGDAGRSDRRVALTFDDGYADNLTVVSPALLDARMPATFFVPTGGTASGFWWDTLVQCLLGDAPGWPAQLRLSCSAGPRVFPTTTAAERLETLYGLYGELIEAPDAARDEALATVVDWAPTGMRSDVRRMTTEELVELSTRPGHDLGSHTVLHPSLPTRPEAEQHLEITASKRDIEALIGRPVVAFSYPYGRWNATSRALVKGAGFAIAVTSSPGALVDPCDPWSLPRVNAAAGPEEGFGGWLEQWLAL